LAILDEDDADTMLLAMIEEADKARGMRENASGPKEGAVRAGSRPARKNPKTGKKQRSLRAFFVTSATRGARPPCGEMPPASAPAGQAIALAASSRPR
jgi:hypothetical protein